MQNTYPDNVVRYKVPAEDEISLLDLWFVIVKHQKVLIFFVVFSLVVGVIFALVKPREYTYRTSIEIGSRLVKEEAKAIENPETVLAKIRESYIPQVLRETFDENVTTTQFKLDARVPKSSQLIVIEAKGTTADGEQLKPVMESVIQKLTADHERIYASLRKAIEIRQSKNNHELESLKDAASLLKAELERKQTAAELIGKEIEELTKLVEETERNRGGAAQRVTAEADAMTLLLLDSQIREGRKRLGELRERLFVSLPSETDSLKKQLGDNERQQKNLHAELAKLDIELKNFRATRAIVLPMRSLEPTGISRKALVALFAMLGVFAGLFAVFVAEFAAKARGYAAGGQSEPMNTPSVEPLPRMAIR